MKTPANLLPAILAQQIKSNAPTTQATAPAFGVAGGMKQLSDFAAIDSVLADMKRLAAEFIAAMWNRREPYCLTLLGAPGTGKTMLAKLINRFFQKFMCDLKVDREEKDGRGALLERWLCKGTLIEWGRAMDAMLSDGFGVMRDYRDYFFLAIDDIAVEHAKMRELSASKLFDILNARLSRRWTIVTANLSFKQIEEMDPRLASRLIRDGNVLYEIPLTTPDYADR